jgi:hypothetical protein
MKDISRKKFLRVCGSIVAGGAVAGVSGLMVNRNMSFPATAKAVVGDFASPYKRVASFTVAAAVEGFDLFDGKLYVAADHSISVYNPSGTLLNNFPTGETVRDIVVNAEGVYLLHPTAVAVYSLEGNLLRTWEACSELSDYCSMAVSEGAVFVTDRANKNICKYTSEGGFVRFIDSPNRFIIPSLTFGIECIDGVVYCSNSGRHQVETYTLEGEYLGCFGKPGGAPGLFTGCCNPVHLAYTAGGDLITSEKGDPRISCYSRDGAFRSILLDSRMMGGGHVAYDVKVHNDRLFIAGKDIVSVFRYDPAPAAQTGACGGCGVACLLAPPSPPKGGDVRYTKGGDVKSL